MGDTILRIIPQDPHNVPAEADQARAVSLLESIFEGSNVDVVIHPAPLFIDPGENFEGVACPSCGADAMDWWAEAMDVAYATDFADLSVTTPCCASSSTLDLLRYNPSGGFARFVIEIWNPQATTVTNEDEVKVAQTLRCDIRTIWAHI